MKNAHFYHTNSPTIEIARKLVVIASKLLLTTTSTKCSGGECRPYPCLPPPHMAIHASPCNVNSTLVQLHAQVKSLKTYLLLSI